MVTYATYSSAPTPTPQQEVTPAQKELNTRISQVQSKIQQNRAIAEDINQAIRRKEQESKEYDAGYDRGRAAQYSQEVDRLTIELGILQNSQTLAEASARKSVYQRQTQAQEISQSEQLKYTKELRQAEIALGQRELRKGPISDEVSLPSERPKFIGPKQLFIGPIQEKGVFSVTTPEIVYYGAPKTTSFMEVPTRISPSEAVEFRDTARVIKKTPLTKSEKFKTTATNFPGFVVEKFYQSVGWVGKQVGKGVALVAPEGVTVETLYRPERKATFYKPAFGTVTDETRRGFTEETIIVPEKPVRRFKIWEPKRVAQGVSFGLGTSVFFTPLTAPVAETVLGPGFFIEGYRSATDTSKTKFERVMGVVEAETGLLMVGGATKFFLGDLANKQVAVGFKPVEGQTLKTPPGIGKRGMAGTTTKQVTQDSKYVYDYTKQKFVLKEVKEFLEEAVGENMKVIRANYLLNKATTPSERAAVIKILEKVYGNKFVKRYEPKVFVIREPPKTSKILSTPLIKTPTTTKTTTTILIPTKTTTQSVFAGTGQYERTGLVALRQFGLSSGSANQLRTQTALLRKSSQAFVPLLNSSQVSGLSSNLRSVQDFAVSQDFTTSQDFVPALDFRTTQTTFSDTSQSSNVGRGSRFRTETFFEPRLRFGLPTDLGSPLGRKKKTARTISKPGYYPEVKVKRKWKRLSQKPLTEGQARTVASRVVDRTTAVQLRLMKAKKAAAKSNIKVNVPRYKYRDYSIRGTSRKPLPNKGLIEKKQFRIDTPTEKKQLSVAKFLKSGGLGYKKRRKK